MTEWTFRPMVVADLSDLVVMQERGAVPGLGHIFPQDAYPFPRERVLERWRVEIDDPETGAYVATDAEGNIVGFAARRADELLHFGTSVETWGTGLATWLHDE